MDKSWRWISWLILGIGELIVAGGLALGYGSLRLVLYGESAPGVVTEISREGDMYAPVFRFRLPTNGEVHEVKALGSGAPRFAVADPVTALYAPADPDDLAIDDFEELWLSAIMVTGFGCFWLMFGAVAWALSRDVELAVLGEGGLHDHRAGRGRAGRHRDVERLGALPFGRAGRRQGHRDSRQPIYAPLVRFTTAEGREIEFLGRGGSGTSYRKGDVVAVAYDPARPVAAHIVSFIDLWLPAAVAWGLALLLLRLAFAPLAARWPAGRALRCQASRGAM